MPKRQVARMKLRRTCVYCGKHFNKGEVYYRHREVAKEDGFVLAYEYLICPRCNYKHIQSARRFERFKERCTHPPIFIGTKYSYIPGECIQEPDYNYCRLCGQVI
jgi:hypothetical protein